ncbi:hypothetical protein LMG28690_03763 [Paraburkholderia caffeinilytica]|nr:hypothetical protein LMG28690_03763 [Paraburkholderia caffeinilytica]
MALALSSRRGPPEDKGSLRRGPFLLLIILLINHGWMQPLIPCGRRSRCEPDPPADKPSCPLYSSSFFNAKARV